MSDDKWNLFNVAIQFDKTGELNIDDIDTFCSNCSQEDMDIFFLRIQISASLSDTLTKEDKRYYVRQNSMRSLKHLMESNIWKRYHREDDMGWFDMDLPHWVLKTVGTNANTHQRFLNEKGNFHPCIGALYVEGSLKLKSDDAVSLPATFGNLVVGSLHIICPKLTTIPDSFSDITVFEELSITGTNLERLPDKFYDYHAGHSGDIHITGTINLSSNRLTEIPIGLVGMNIVDMNLNNNEISSIPENIRGTTFTSLHLSHNKIQEIPSVVKDLSVSHTLDLSYNHISEIPAEVGQLILMYLDISNNVIHSVSPELKELVCVKGINLSHNKLLRLPYGITGPINLTSNPGSRSELMFASNAYNFTKLWSYPGINTTCNIEDKSPLLPTTGDIRWNALRDRMTIFPLPLLYLEHETTYDKEADELNNEGQNAMISILRKLEELDSSLTLVLGTPEEARQFSAMIPFDEDFPKSVIQLRDVLGSLTINKYHESGCRDFPHLNLADRLIDLTITNTDLGDYCLGTFSKLLANCTTIKNLVLSNTTLPMDYMPGEIESISKAFAHIERISIEESVFPSQIFDYFSTNLKQLVIVRNYIPVSIKHVSHISMLESLTVDRASINLTDSGVVLYNLTRCHFSNVAIVGDISGIGTFFRGLPVLKNVVFKNITMTDNYLFGRNSKEWESLVFPDTLETLDVSGNSNSFFSKLSDDTFNIPSALKEIIATNMHEDVVLDGHTFNINSKIRNVKKTNFSGNAGVI